MCDIPVRPLGNFFFFLGLEFDGVRSKVKDTVSSQNMFLATSHTFVD